MTVQQLQKGKELLEKLLIAEEHLRFVNKELELKEDTVRSHSHLKLKGFYTASLGEDIIDVTKWSFMRQRWLNEYKAEVEKVVAELQKEFDSL